MSTSKPWTWSEDKAFEAAVAAVLPAREDDARWWRDLAARVPARSPAEVRTHYEVMVEDIKGIEAGRVPIPRYVGEEEEVEEVRGSKAEQERRKGIPWTEEEHKLFLLGLSKYGKGDWRSISRNYVISRTPTQVASHAQKYFIRLNSMNRDRRRSSIHDITSVNGGNTAAATPHGQIPSNGSVVVPHKHLPPPVYIPGAPMGHIVSAVGTPVMLPPGRPPYVVPMAYPVPSPLQGMHR